MFSKTWSISCNSDSAGEDTDDPSHPGPSHVTVIPQERTDDQSEIQEEEKCCICRQFTPDEVRNSVSLIFTKLKWVQCSNEDCKHWVHLGYCTPKRVIRRGEVFYCTHCEDKWIRWTMKDVNMFKFIVCVLFWS